MTGISRRQILRLGLAAPLLPLTSGCRASLPPESGADTGAAALALLRDSADAHGLSAFRGIQDLNVSYAGHWRRLVAKIQPELVDAGFRGGSQERLLLRDGVIAQSHQGPSGSKQVVRTYLSGSEPGTHVWFNGAPSQNRAQVDAAALVVDAYALFLLGPLWLVTNQWPARTIQASTAPAADLKQGGNLSVCDVVNLRLSPGLGNSVADRLAIYVDHQTRLMRRVRMTLNGLESTQGALVDIDTYDHHSLHDVMWPTSFHERLLRPAPLDVHAWRLTGIDINRGESPDDVLLDAFRGKAVEPAAPLPA